MFVKKSISKYNQEKNMLSTGLISKTFDYFNKYKNLDFVVSPSLPILYFGDLKAYSNSEYKVITVGKNPSDNEFRLKKDDSFSFVRFSKWNESSQNLVQSLNHYFEDQPLRQWFSSFEPILNGMSSSYYKNDYPNTALHTDVCSPLATNPTWSKLSTEEQYVLFKEGFEIWKELVEELQPDIMLVSIRRDLFKKIFTGEGKELITFTDTISGNERRPYKVELYEFTLKSQKKVKVVFGQAANKPFDKISNLQKVKIGELCQK